VAERVMRQVLCLPIHVGLVDEQIKDISSAFEMSIEESRKG
jgi:dTDP-4-amino-4,6-dideoxygalactose transaminase